jgi:paraquat-inducible protein B
MAERLLVACHCCGLVQSAANSLSPCACCRCETRLSTPTAFADNQRSAAIAAAALALSIPALTLPFLRIERLGQSLENSLIGGVSVLFEERHLLVGFVVLLCSIILPLCKLSALLVLSLQPDWLQSRHRAFTYRAVEKLGRWGMLDVLLVAVMIAFIKLGTLVSFSAGSGLATFVAFVIFSMLASLAFDPHLLWKPSHLSASNASAPATPPAGSTVPASTTATQAAVDPPIPESRPPVRRHLSWAWLIPTIVMLISIGTYVASWRNRGTEIEISFQNGYGLRAGDELKHHGVAAGKIEAVELNADGSGIKVKVRLLPGAAGLARRGSRFWIVRPQIDLTGISGIDTVLGGKQLAVAPGPRDAPMDTRFIGLETAPLLDADIAGGLEVIVNASSASGIRPGLPVHYRDLRVGGVRDVRLAVDGSAVELVLMIRPQFRQLIREKTVFWQSSGVTVDAGLTGMRLHLESVESLIRGGIALAVPDEPGALAPERRFELSVRAPEGWTEWKPAIPSPELTLAANRPPQDRAVLAWENRGFFRTTSVEVAGWLLPVADGYLAPKELAESENEAAVLRIAGTTLPLATTERSDRGSHLTAISSNPPPQTQAKTRIPSQPEDGLLVAGDEPPIVIAANRLMAEGDAWKIDKSIQVPEHWRGAAFVAVRDHAVVGLLCPTDAEPVIAPLVAAPR